MAACVLAVAAPASAELLAYYTFEGATDTQRLQNVAGASYSGTFIDTVPEYQSGSGVNGSGAYLFGGTFGSTFTPINIGLNISPAALPNVTFGGWFKATVVSGERRGLISHDDGGFDRSLLISENDSYCGFTGFNVAPCDSNPVETGEWVFLALAYDGVNGKVRLTVNGTHSVEVVGFPGGGETETTLGRNPNHDAPFAGYMDNVFFYDEYLDTAQLDQVRLNGAMPASVPEPGTAALMLGGLAVVAAGRLRRKG